MQAGKACKATENCGVTLLTPPECGKLDHRQRCRLCCCLAPRWRRSLLTAFGANCQGISAEKSCLQVFSRPLTIGKVAIRRSPDRGSTKPTESAQGRKGAETGRWVGEENDGSEEAQRPKAGGHNPRAPPTSAQTPDTNEPRAAAETSQNF